MPIFATSSHLAAHHGSGAPGWAYKDPLNTTKAPVPQLGGNRALYLYSVVLEPLLGVALTGGLRAPIPLQRSNNEPLAEVCL
jgi:hypothetical protein